MLASTISQMGNGLTALAVPWFVLVTTGSAARTGIAGGLVALATVLSGLLGGAAVDRLGFRRASILSDLASGVTVALIPTLHLLDVLAYWHLLVLVFLGAVFDAPGNSARRALIPGLARRARMGLERANSAMEFAGNGSRTLLGPVVAGLLIGTFGAANVLYIDAVTFAVSILIIALIVLSPPAASVQESAAGGLGARGKSYLSDMKEGFAYVLRDPFMSTVIPVSVLMNFLFAPLFAVVLPVFTRESFGSAGALGLLIGAFGAGTAVGTLAFGAGGHRLGRYAMFVTGIGAIAFGYWWLTISGTLWMGVAALVLVGLAVGPTNALAMVIIQGRAPDEMLGRIFGTLFAMTGAAAPLGVFAGGFLVEGLGVRAVMVISATGVTLAAAWVGLSPKMRALAHELDADRERLTA